MSSQGVPGPAPRPAPRPWLRRAILLVAAGGLACAGWFAWQTWLDEKPPLPAIDLANAQADLVDMIEGAEADVRANPHSAESWGRLGMILLAHDYSPEASQCFVEAQKHESGGGRWLYLDAQACYKIYPLRAITLLEKAVQEDGEDTTYRMLLGELLLEQGRLDEAERHLLRAVQSEPLRPWAEVRLAQVALRRGQSAQALEHAKRAQERLEDGKLVCVVLSEIYFRLGEVEAAEQQQQKALRLPVRSWPDPHMEAVERLKVSTLPLIAQANQDVAALEAVVRAHPASAPARISLALALAKRQEWQAAAEAATQALKINPNDAVALNVLGFALLKQGLLDDAAAAYKRSIEVNPHNAVTHYELASCYYRLDKKQLAVESLRAAIRLRPNYANAWRELGQFLAQDNDAEAVACLRRAVELAPDDAKARKLLEDARKRLDKAGPSGPR